MVHLIQMTYDNKLFLKLVVSLIHVAMTMLLLQAILMLILSAIPVF